MGLTKLNVDFLSDFDEQTLIDELQRVARALRQGTLSRRDIDRHAKMSSATVLRHFGSLRQGLQAAGLRPTRFMKASDQELLDILEDVWVASLAKYGRRPERADLKTFESPVSGDTVVRRFGSWRKALVATAERAENATPLSDPFERMPSTKSTSVSANKKSLSIRKRFLVLKRDRYQCRICNAAGVALEVDHVVPVARGGTDRLDNLQTLCFACNRGKRDSLQ